MTKRATKRPETFVKPAHWSDKPAPKPAAPEPHTKAKDGDHEGGLSPTRYGDWVKNGIAIDF